MGVCVSAVRAPGVVMCFWALLFSSPRSTRAALSLRTQRQAAAASSFELSRPGARAGALLEVGMRARRFPAYHAHPPSTQREPRALSRSARTLGGAHGARRAQRRSCIGKGAAEELPPNGVRNAGHRGPIPNKCGARARTPRAGHVACVARRVRRPPCPKRPLASARRVSPCK